MFGEGNLKVIDLIEGEPAVVNMTALANPSRIEYTWSKDPHQVIPNGVTNSDREMKSLNEIRTQKRVFAYNGLLNVSQVKREDSGIYTITATNEEGATETRIEINVLYEPR